MGTNYYHENGEGRCAACGRVCASCSPAEHIGKSGAGWQFSFHATETERCFQDWRRRLEAGGVIRDEYGNPIPLARFLAMVEDKRTEPRNHGALYSHYGDYVDAEGYSFSPGEFS